MQILIGIANSVSSNFGYDPLDALRFAHQSKFDFLQVFINNELLNQEDRLEILIQESKANPNSRVYIHAEGLLNKQWLKSEYTRKFLNFLERIEENHFIIHFDEGAALEEILEVIHSLSRMNRTIYLENYFQSNGTHDAEKNMRKYLAIFTLSNNPGQPICLYPVLDIPRFFHKKLGLDKDAALSWCFQMLNYFDNRKIPILLHLIDAKEQDQKRSSFCPVGEGYIPYDQIFGFIKKIQPLLSGIVLEFEDKLNTLKSRDNLMKMIQ